MRNKNLTRIIIATLLCALLVNAGRATRVSALAVGPLADPVYDTELFAFKDYVEQNLDTGQLDIAFLLWGALAAAQLGAQDAQLISPYPNEENVKEWLINCGLQLYNSVIGLVPSGDYYMGIPSIGTAGQKGIPRQLIKGLVATMMGDAVLAINYTDLDDFLEQNPDELYIPFNPDLQLGLNAVFGLNGGAEEWQITQRSWSSGNFNYYRANMSGVNQTDYNGYLNSMSLPRYLINPVDNTSYYYNNVISSGDLPLKYDLFINTHDYTVSFHNAVNRTSVKLLTYYSRSGGYVYLRDNGFITFRTETYNPSRFSSYHDIATYYLNYIPPDYYSTPALVYAGSPNSPSNCYFANFDLVDRVMVGPTWESAVEVQNLDDLNFEIDQTQYYQQLTNDYLLDIRGLISDLVGVTDVFNQIKDNLYDLTGIIQLNPNLINVSVDLPDISLLVDPPVPVNLNDFAIYSQNDYLEEIKDRGEKFGETIGEYFVFWHNADPVTVYVIFGSVIVILLGAFVGKLGHS